MSSLQHKTLIINLVIISLERYSNPVERMKSLRIMYVWGPRMKAWRCVLVTVTVFNILFFVWPTQSSSYFSIVQFWNILFYFASLYNGIEQIGKYNKNGRELFNVSERRIILIAWLLYSLMFLATCFPNRCHPHNDPARRACHLSSFTGKKIEHVAVKSLQGHSTSEGKTWLNSVWIWKTFTYIL